MAISVLLHLLAYVATATDQADTIECGETKRGSFAFFDTMDVSYTFVNDQIQDVIFTNCDTLIANPKLFLTDSAGRAIHNQSVNNCDGDDCFDVTYCDRTTNWNSWTETFEMAELAVGTYTIRLFSYAWGSASGGNYSLTVYCEELGDFNMTTTEEEQRSTTADIKMFSGPYGSYSLSRIAVCDDSL